MGRRGSMGGGRSSSSSSSSGGGLFSSRKAAPAPARAPARSSSTRAAPPPAPQQQAPPPAAAPAAAPSTKLFPSSLCLLYLSPRSWLCHSLIHYDHPVSFPACCSPYRMSPPKTPLGAVETVAVILWHMWHSHTADRRRWRYARWPRRNRDAGYGLRYR